MNLYGLAKALQNRTANLTHTEKVGALHDTCNDRGDIVGNEFMAHMNDGAIYIVRVIQYKGPIG